MLAKEFGTELQSRSLGRQLRTKLVATTLGGGHATLDFGGVISASGPFLDELFVALAKEKGSAWFNTHVRVKNLPPELRSRVTEVVREWENLAQQRGDLVSTAELDSPGELDSTPPS